MARIEKDFAVTREFAKNHPPEAASRTAQKELAQFLVGVKRHNHLMTQDRRNIEHYKPVLSVMN